MINNDGLFSRLFTYCFLLVSVIVSLWLSTKILNLTTFFFYGILGLVLTLVPLSASLKLCMSNAVNFNWLDLACSLIILGLSVWSIFSCLKLWI